MKQSCPVPRAFRLSAFYTLEGVVARMDAMQQELKAFKDPALARGAHRVHSSAGPGVCYADGSVRHPHRGHCAQRHSRPYARGGSSGVGPWMSGVRDEQPRHRQGNRAGPCAGSGHRHLRRYDPRARLHVQLAGRAGGGALGGDRLLAAGRPASGAGEPGSANRLRRRGLRNHHAAGGYGHQTSARHGTLRTSPYTAPTRTCPGRWRSSSTTPR